jgi:hypothetical protein
MNNSRFHAIVLAALACLLNALPAAADSQARIVRLSDVQGGVQINKNTGLGFENAFLNLPITQGVQLRTRGNGRAEIELEDGSTLRITPNTTIEFSTLAANDAGKHISAVNLADGRLYVNWQGKSGDRLTLNFAQEKIDIAQPAHFRAETSAQATDVASFRNQLAVTDPSGTAKVEKNKEVAFDENDQPSAAKSFKTDSYDEWDKQAVSYHEDYARNDNTPYGYGYSDLNYYGSFSNLPGYGQMWQPYFTGVGWNPYMDGAWAWYPGTGYMWASAYPWGWMPYFYGNWTYAPGFGWGWQPGGWSGWHGGLHYVNAAAGFHPPTAPSGIVNTVVVGKGGPTLTAAPALGTVIRGGSAGLGIARGSVDNLHHLNTQVAKTGFAEVHGAPQFSATSARIGGGFGGERGTMSAGAHPASAPAGHSSGGGGSGHH